mmetsp:Transcript_63236/g.137538  ORF Transcript_63236/g.137538 Transcript_63236/m.137538 type:complete len:440 (-) Transcript_63236:70-1389(-)
MEAGVTGNDESDVSLPGQRPQNVSLPTIADMETSKRGKAKQPVRIQRRREAPKREAFLSGLINQDLQSLTQWHGKRPHHEQKRFLRSVDALYKSFSALENGPTPAEQAQAAAQARAMSQAQAAANAAALEAAAAAAAKAAEEDPLHGPPRTPRGHAAARLGSSASAPSLPSKPIDVFEQRKRDGLRHGADEEINTLERWLESGSVTTATTGTTATSRYTSLSQLTKTSSGGSRSICSEPGTTNQAAYRIHRRAFAVNAGNMDNANQHEAGALKGGIPNCGFPTSERMNTTFKDAYGSRPLGSTTMPTMLEGVIHTEKQPFVSRFLETAPQQQRDQLANMVRSLQYLRRDAARKGRSMGSFDYDLEENRRLWRPPRQRPVFDTSEINLSQIPLGSIGQAKGQLKARDANAGVPLGYAPSSPSVSGLGSLPLSRLSTPKAT